MAQLKQSEVAALNVVIDQCEKLVNARGVVGMTAGMFDAPPLRILMRRTEAYSALQIEYRHEPVLRVQWVAGAERGKVWQRPGAWRAELMGLRVHDA